MKGYPLGVAGFVAMACDCIRRGDLVGAEKSLARANRLSQESEGHLGGGGSRGDRASAAAEATGA